MNTKLKHLLALLLGFYASLLTSTPAQSCQSSAFSLARRQAETLIEKGVRSLTKDLDSGFILMEGSDKTLGFQPDLAAIYSEHGDMARSIFLQGLLDYHRSYLQRIVALRFYLYEIDQFYFGIEDVYELYSELSQVHMAWSNQNNQIQIADVDVESTLRTKKHRYSDDLILSQYSNFTQLDHPEQVLVLELAKGIADLGWNEKQVRQDFMDVYENLSSAHHRDDFSRLYRGIVRNIMLVSGHTDYQEQIADEIALTPHSVGEDSSLDSDFAASKRLLLVQEIVAELPKTFRPSTDLGRHFENAQVQISELMIKRENSGSLKIILPTEKRLYSELMALIPQSNRRPSQYQSMKNLIRDDLFQDSAPQTWVETFLINLEFAATSRQTISSDIEIAALDLFKRVLARQDDDMDAATLIRLARLFPKIGTSHLIAMRDEIKFLTLRHHPNLITIKEELQSIVSDIDRLIEIGYKPY